MIPAAGGGLGCDAPLLLADGVGLGFGSGSIASHHPIRLRRCPLTSRGKSQPRPQ